MQPAPNLFNELTSAEVLLKAMEIVLLEGSAASGFDSKKSTLKPLLSNA